VVVLTSGLVKDIEPLVIGIVYLVAALTVASGLDYILRSNQLVGDRDKAA
jgi:hypothetical protein